MSNTIRKQNMSVIAQLVEDVKGKSFTEQGMMSHKIIMALGQGTLFPVEDAAIALNANKALMLRANTILPSPMFINIQENFMSKLSSKEAKETGKRYKVNKKLSHYDFERIVNNFETLTKAYGKEKAVTGLKESTGYMFIDETFDDLELIRDAFQQDLHALAEISKNLKKETTDPSELPEDIQKMIAIMTPEEAEPEDITQITKWHPIAIPEGLMIPVYSTGFFKKSHWENFSLSNHAPYERDNTYWRSTYTNLDNNTDTHTEEAVKLSKAIRAIKDQLK